MIKKLLIPAIVVIVLGGGLGIFIWQNQKQQSEKAVGEPAPPRQAEQFDPWATEPADDVVIEETPSGDQLVKNITQGYQVTVPKDWYVEKPQGGDVDFRVLPPQDSTCYQLGFSKEDNSQQKSPEQFYKDTVVAHGEIGEGEYTIEPYESELGGAIIITTSAPRWHSKNLYVARGEYIYTLTVVSDSPDTPLNTSCEQIFFDAIKTISLES